ncbi:MAG TPA: HepT-like ribonuclease domain-containing protein [Gryllotalpicola sp.]
MSRSADDLISDILDAIERCTRYRERFEDNDPEVVEMAFGAAIRYIGVIGEAANHLPPSITDQHPEIPWAAIVEMRNIVVHEYFGVDTSIVTSTLDRDLKPLAAALGQHLRQASEPN